MVTIAQLASKRGVSRRSIERYLPRLVCDRRIPYDYETGRGNRLVVDERQAAAALDALEAVKPVMRSSRWFKAGRRRNVKANDR